MKQLIFHIEILENNIKIVSEIFEYIDDIYKFPLNMQKYNKIKQDDFKLLDVIAYRFLKTQSILGEKVFKEILEFSEFDVKNRSYFEILSELEREGILNIDEWKIFRNLRNTLSHDYPYNEEEIVEAINFLFEDFDNLKKIILKIKERYEKISKIKYRRDSNNQK